jgi:hypothetical protein
VNHPRATEPGAAGLPQALGYAEAALYLHCATNLTAT